MFHATGAAGMRRETWAESCAFVCLYKVRVQRISTIGSNLFGLLSEKTAAPALRKGVDQRVVQGKFALARWSPPAACRRPVRKPRPSLTQSGFRLVLHVLRFIRLIQEGGIPMKVETLNLTATQGPATAYVARPDTDAAAAIVL